MATNLVEVNTFEAAQELVHRRAARSSVLGFTQYTKPNYETNWHHRVLCEHLDAFVAGDIKRLLVSMPPRHGKSELVSRRLPAYIFGRNPDANIMSASYSADLSRRFNRDVQRIIDSVEYEKLFPVTKLYGKNIRSTSQGTWLRNSDVFEIVGYDGMYKCSGVGGSLTGFGFDYGIIDDPVKDAKEASSETFRQRVWEWYTDVFWTRQAKGAGILLTMTRWHMDDLAGRILEMLQQSDSEEWVVLTLPAILEDDTVKHDSDPRAFGQALWPERYPCEMLEKAKAQNQFSFSALYQQHPIPYGDTVFDTTKIQIIDSAPDNLQTVRFYDLAVTAKKHSDYTAGAKLGVDSNENLYILHMYRAQKTPTNVQADIIQNAHIDGRQTRIRLEAEKAGIVQLDYLLREPALRGYTLDAKPPQGDKFTRAQPFASRVNAGKVFMVRGAWNRAALDELAVFPMGANDDQVDAFSGAYDMLSTPAAATITEFPDIFGHYT